MAFIDLAKKRYSSRKYLDKPVDRELLLQVLEAGRVAPSAKNKQPWHFVVVINPEIKKQIRAKAEKEEQEFYSKRVTKEWMADLEALETDANKPFLETAPVLIVIFAKSYDLAPILDESWLRALDGSKDLSIEDFYLVKNTKGKIEAIFALWDQRKIKQVVIESYRTPLNKFRFLYNCIPFS